MSVHDIEYLQLVERAGVPRRIASRTKQIAFFLSSEVNLNSIENLVAKSHSTILHQHFFSLPSFEVNWRHQKVRRQKEKEQNNAWYWRITQRGIQADKDNEHLRRLFAESFEMTWKGHDQASCIRQDKERMRSLSIAIRLVIEPIANFCRASFERRIAWT